MDNLLGSTANLPQELFSSAQLNKLEQKKSWTDNLKERIVCGIVTLTWNAEDKEHLKQLDVSAIVASNWLLDIVIDWKE